MTSTDVLKFLFDRWKEKNGGGTQDEFADHLDLSRPHMNQFLTGKKIPPRSTMKRILMSEGYKSEDIKIQTHIDIDFPDAKSARREFDDLFDNLQTIVTLGGPRRIEGIRINLEEFADGARGKKGKRSNLLRAVKKKESK